MPGKFNGTTLGITATPTAGALLPDVTDSSKNLTNVAGIAMVGDDLYCVKTSGTKTSLLKISNYDSTNGSSSVVGNLKVPYFALGLTKVGNMLYMLAETYAGYGGTTRIIKTNTSGKKQGDYPIDDIFPDGALGITQTGNGEEFFILGYGENIMPVVKRIQISDGQAVEKEKFEVKNSGYGYTYQLQDIYYHMDYGLFILTNDKMDTGKNKILLIDYKVGTKQYTPSAVIEVNLPTSQYAQYNLESICMKNNNLVLASNIKLENGSSEDRISILKGIKFVNGTYSFTCAMTQGMIVPNDTIEGIPATNFGAIAMGDNNKLYGIKAGSNKDYGSAETCVSSVFYLTNYNSTSGEKHPIRTIKPTEKSICLYHANGMDYYKENLYIACGEVAGIKQNSFVRMDQNGTTDSIVRFSNGQNRANAISHYKEDQFIIYTQTKNTKDQKTSLTICCLQIGKFDDTQKIFKVLQTYYFLNTGYGVFQDIFYHEKYGLFVVTCDIDVDTKHTKANRVLHIDPKRKKNLTTTKGTKLDVIIPNFALDNNGDKSKFNNFELESLALDPVTKNLIASANATNTSNKMEDGIYRFSSLEFL